MTTSIDAVICISLVFGFLTQCQLFLVLFFVSGCFVRYVPVESRYPLIDVVERPVLAVEPEFSEREVQLANYARQLEAMIDRYNALARAHNELHGYFSQPLSSKE